MTGEASGIPARGYSWAPFEKGHTVTLRHGVNSETAIEAKAVEVHAAITEVAPWLAEPTFVPELARYLRASAREQLAHDGVVKAAEERGADKIPPRLLEQASGAARLASQLAAGLGLTPIGHARLKAVSGAAAVTEATLADVMASGRQARLAAEARMALEASGTKEAPQRPVEATNGARAPIPHPERSAGHTDDLSNTNKGETPP